MRLLKVMMAASVAIPLAAFGYASWTAYHDAFAHADEPALQHFEWAGRRLQPSES